MTKKAGNQPEELKTNECFFSRLNTNYQLSEKNTQKRQECGHDLNSLSWNSVKRPTLSPKNHDQEQVICNSKYNSIFRNLLLPLRFFNSCFGSGSNLLG